MHFNVLPAITSLWLPEWLVPLLALVDSCEEMQLIRLTSALPHKEPFFVGWEAEFIYNTILGAGRASPTHTPRADVNPSASAGRSPPPQSALKLLELPETLPGRPPLKKLLVVPDGACASDVAVYTCGPAPMVASVQELCLDEGFLCHEETFEF